MLGVLGACARAPVVRDESAARVVTAGDEVSPRAVRVAPAGLGVTARQVEGADGLRQLCEQLQDEDRVSWSGSEVERERLRALHRVRRSEASVQRYVAEVPPGAFAVAPYDAAERRLALRPGALSVGDGAQLDLADSEASGGFALTSAQADEVLRGIADNRLRLRVLFRPAVSPLRGDACLLRPGGLAKLEGSALGLYLVDEHERIVAAQEADEVRQARAAVTPVAAARVDIEPPTSDAETGARETPAAWTEAVRSARPELLTCYREALTRGPSTRGTLVVSARAVADGRLEGARMEVSSLEDRQLVDCAVARLARVRLPGAAPASRISMAVRFGGESETDGAAN